MLNLLAEQITIEGDRIFYASEMEPLNRARAHGLAARRYARLRSRRGKRSVSFDSISGRRSDETKRFPSS